MSDEILQKVADWCDKHELSFAAGAELEEILNPLFDGSESIADLNRQLLTLLDRIEVDRDWKLSKQRFKLLGKYGEVTLHLTTSPKIN